MPSIKVSERDLSWYFRQREQGAATVFVPLLATFGPEDMPVLCTSNNFANTFGENPVSLENEMSYNIAASFISSGFNVLARRFVPSGAKAAESGTLGDGTNNFNFVAAYAGTFGNSIIVSSRVTSNTPTSKSIISSITIGNTIVERLVFELVDKTSSNYYTKVESNYISLVPVEEADFSQLDMSTLGTNFTVSLTGGLDFEAGKTATEVYQEVWAQIKEGIAVEELKDPYQYDFDIIVSGGFALYENGLSYYGTEENQPFNFSTDIDFVDQTLMNLAINRGTSIYLVDGASNWDAQTLYTYCGNFDTSYVAAYGPWGYAQYLNTGELALLPGSYAMIVKWAQSCANGTPIWMAPAGVKRSTMGSFYKDTKYFVGKSVLDIWQNHNYADPGSYQVNPVMRARQYGFIIYGNSTLLKTRSDGATSMLQQFSVRVMSNLIKRRAFDVALNLQFDQLTGDLFTQFRTVLGTFMDQLLYQGALYDYQIVLTHGTLTSADLNERTLPVTIRISPNPAVENFDIVLEISQSGVSFTDETDETEVG